MSQLALPVADISTGLWTPTPVFAQINRSPTNDQNMVTSSSNPANDAFVVALPDSLQWPQIGAETVTVRLRMTESGGTTVHVVLLQGSNPIATRQFAPTTSFQNYSFTLSVFEQQRITDYTNLRLQVVAGAGLFNLVFNGVNQYVFVGNPSILQITGPITISAWITASVGASRMIVSKNGPGGAGGTLAYYLWVGGGGAVQFGLSPDGTNQTTVAWPISPVQLYHVCGVWDGTNMRLYLNGSQVASTAYGGPIYRTPANFLIGASYPYSLSIPDFLFDGMIGAVRIYNTGLGSAHVSEIYGGGAGLATAGSASANLVGWWKFGEGTGNTAADSSGNNNPGTLQNSPTWTPGTILG